MQCTGMQFNSAYRWNSATIFQAYFNKDTSYSFNVELEHQNTRVESIGKLKATSNASQRSEKCFKKSDENNYLTFVYIRIDASKNHSTKMGQ